MTNEALANESDLLRQNQALADSRDAWRQRAEAAERLRDGAQGE